MATTSIQGGENLFRPQWKVTTPKAIHAIPKFLVKIQKRKHTSSWENLMKFI